MNAFEDDLIASVDDCNYYDGAGIIVGQVVTSRPMLAIQGVLAIVNRALLGQASDDAVIQAMMDLPPSVTAWYREVS